MLQRTRSEWLANVYRPCQSRAVHILHNAYSWMYNGIKSPFIIGQLAPYVAVAMQRSGHVVIQYHRHSRPSHTHTYTRCRHSATDTACHVWEIHRVVKKWQMRKIADLTIWDFSLHCWWRHLTSRMCVTVYCVHTSVLFLSRYLTAYLNRMFIMSPSTSLSTYLQKWRQVLLNGVDGRSVIVSSLSLANKSYRSKTN